MKKILFAIISILLLFLLSMVLVVGDSKISTHGELESLNIGKKLTVSWGADQSRGRFLNICLKDDLMTTIPMRFLF